LTRSVLLLAVALLLVAVPVASGGPERSAGSLALQAELSVTAIPAPTCPLDAPPGADLCSPRSGSGRMPGVGFVTESYNYVVDLDPVPSCGGVHPLQSTGQIAVAGKSTIQFDLGRTDQCFPDVYKTNQRFTVTGGSGAYAGATGAGSLNHDLSTGGGGAEPTGTDAWSGSLDVPGLEFDRTPPTLTGLVDRIVRVRKGVKRVRVRYRVTARDVVDGARTASCQPASGSRFRVGRTVVKCLSSDLSANTATGSFRVTVKRRR
jgi:HYR domain-containing protein